MILLKIWVALVTIAVVVIAVRTWQYITILVGIADAIAGAMCEQDDVIIATSERLSRLIRILGIVSGLGF